MTSHRAGMSAAKVLCCFFFFSLFPWPSHTFGAPMARLVRAPDFTLGHLAGEGSVTLSKLHHDKVVMLEFWESWRGGLKDELRRGRLSELDSLAGKWKEKGLELLLVLPVWIPVEEMRMASTGMTQFTILLDQITPKSVSSLYRRWQRSSSEGLPCRVIIDRLGYVKAGTCSGTFDPTRLLEELTAEPLDAVLMKWAGQWTPTLKEGLDEAVETYRNVVRLVPESEFADDALYYHAWLSHYYLYEYDEAARSYGLLRDRPEQVRLSRDYNPRQLDSPSSKNLVEAIGRIEILRQARSDLKEALAGSSGEDILAAFKETAKHYRREKNFPAAVSAYGEIRKRSLSDGDRAEAAFAVGVIQGFEAPEFWTDSHGRSLDWRKTDVSLKKGIETFRDLAAKYPRTRWAPRALLEASRLETQAVIDTVWAAERSHPVQGNFSGAEELLGRLVREYRDAPFLDEALFLLGQALESDVAGGLSGKRYGLARFEEALDAYRELVVDHPGSDFAGEAKRRMRGIERGKMTGLRFVVESKSQFGAPVSVLPPDPRSLEELTAALGGGEAAVRVKAAWALGDRGDPGAVVPLAAALREGGVRLRYTAAWALAKIGGAGIDTLFSALGDESEDVRARAAWALGETGDERAVDPLTATLKDTRPQVRKEAALALGKLKSPLSKAHLEEALVDESPPVRHAAAWALGARDGAPTSGPRMQSPSGGKPRDPPDFDTLIETLREGDVKARQKAAATLGPLRNPAALDPLLAALKDERRRVRDEAERALWYLGPSILDTLEGLARSEDEEYRMRSVRLIGNLGGPEKVPVVLGFVKDESPMVRMAAMSVLGRKGDERAVEPLIEALRKDEDETVRKTAARVLGELKDPRAVDPLLEVSREDGQDVRNGALYALQKMGSAAAVDAFVADLKDSRRHVRIGAARFLAFSRDPRAFQPLVAALKDGEADVRGYAAAGLGVLGDPRAVDHLLKALREEGGKNYKVIAALGRLGDPRAAGELAVFLRKDEPYLRAYASEALGRMGAKDTAPRILPLVKDKNSFVRRNAVEALGRLKDESGLDSLIGALRDPDAAVREKAAEALGSLKDSRALGPLIEAVRNILGTNRVAAARALGGIGDPGALVPLVEILKDVDEHRNLRVAAAAAIAALGTPESSSAVAGALKDDSYDVRREAARGLGVLKAVDFLPQLVEALSDKAGVVRIEAARSLGLLGDSRAVDSLKKALEDDHPEVRRAAAESLEKLR